MRLILLPPLLLIAAVASAAQPVTGRWITQDGKAIVTIGDCGKTVCGRVTRILAPTPQGPPLDENNPNRALRRRPVLGLEILSGFTDAGNDWRGRIYSPEEGKTYKSILQRQPNGTLKAQGCVLFFCKTLYWKPAP